MSPTVHQIRNAIRLSTGRFEREVDASFTKEELQAICEAIGVTVNEGEQPSKPWMRRHIRTHAGIAESRETADDSTFRKADLQTIADMVGATFKS